MSPETTSVRREAKKLGRLPAKSDPRALMFRRFATAPKKLPEATSFWRRRGHFDLRTFGNNTYSDCTRAKQAVAAMRMARIESRRTPVIADEEVIRVYFDMTKRLYGGGDTGAYEQDALSEWRRPASTFRDTSGRALTIDAFTKINHSDQQEIREALFIAGAHGIAACFNLPAAWKTVNPPARWDLPDGHVALGEWMPGSWGGHSMWARDYDRDGLWVVHTWGLSDQLVTWRAVAAYMDEAYVVLDSMDYWRTKKPVASKYLDLVAIKKAVNQVSSHPLK